MPTLQACVIKEMQKLIIADYSESEEAEISSSLTSAISGFTARRATVRRFDEAIFPTSRD